MKSIYFKELKQFFASPIGYLSMGMFFLLSALFLWIIEGAYYLPAYRFADLNPFFDLAPWILIFVIAALSMKSFSEEFKTGTIENLLTKPITQKDIVIGKFLAIWSLGLIMLLPTLIYVYTVQSLSMEGSLDYKNLLSAYIGLALLIGNFAAIGVFSSVLFSNQVNAFLLGLFLMFFLFYGLQGISSFNLLGSLDLFFQKLSLNEHYQNLVKGLFKLSDVVYLLSISALFILLSINTLQKRIQ